MGAGDNRRIQGEERAFTQRVIGERKGQDPPVGGGAAGTRRHEVEMIPPCWRRQEIITQLQIAAVRWWLMDEDEVAGS